MVLDVDGEIICSNWVYLVDDAIFYLFRDKWSNIFLEIFFFLDFLLSFFRFDKQLLCIMWSRSFEFQWKRLIYHVQVICVLFRGVFFIQNRIGSKGNILHLNHCGWVWIFFVCICLIRYGYEVDFDLIKDLSH